MREHQHLLHQPSNPQPHPQQQQQQQHRRPCELFVPRVKESRLCTICGFTLIDHDVEPVHYHIPSTTTVTPLLQNLNNSGLQHSKSADTSRNNNNNNYLIDDEYQSLSTSNLLIPTCLIHSSSISSSPIYMTAHNSFRSLDTHLTPSFNSAFSEYKRSPSRDSIAISDISASPISFKSPSFSHYDIISSQHQHQQLQNNNIGNVASSSLSKIDLRHPPTILKPKPLPMPRPYLKQSHPQHHQHQHHQHQQMSLAPTMEDEHEDDEPEHPQRSPAMFKRIRHKRKDRSASAHAAERNSTHEQLLSASSLNPMEIPQQNIRHSVAAAGGGGGNGNQEAVVRPQNFKEILNRFQSAAEDNNSGSAAIPPPPFQRHHSVRLPSSTQQNRRFTLGGEALHIDTAKAFSTLASGFNNPRHNPTSTTSNSASPMTTAISNGNAHGQLQPPPIVKLRASTVPINYHQHQHQQSQMSPYSDIDDSGVASKTVVQIPLREKSNNVQRRESDAYQAAIKARRTGLIGSFIESNKVATKENQHSSDEEEDDDFRHLRHQSPLLIQQQQSHLRRQYPQHPQQPQQRRSSPDEDNLNKFRTSKVNTPTVTVTTQEVVSTAPPPPIKKRQSKMSKSSNHHHATTATIPIDGQFQAKEAVLTVTKPKPPNRSSTAAAATTAATTTEKEIQRKLSTLSQHSTHSNTSSIKNIIDENSNEKNNKNQSSYLQNGNESRAPTAEYLSGGSDSGYPRGRWSHSAETSSLESPRSPSQLLRSPNPHRIKAAEDLYTQMTVQHTTTLAFLVDNFSDIARLHGEFSEFGRDLFDEVSVDTLVFKSSSPLMTKEKLALFDAIFVAPNYAEHKVTVMLAPTCQYAPLMGRNAERSGFGPIVLAEIEEPELTLRNLLDQAGIEPSQRSSIYRLVIMPPLSLCSFHSLAAHNMHKAMNVQRYEHHVCFIMLQLLCALKVLQSDGVEHLSNNFKEFLLTYRAIDLKTSLDELHHLPKLLLLRETMEEEYDDFNAPLSSSADIQRVGVCRYALRALCTLLNHKMNNVIPPILERTEFSRSLRRCAELLHMDKSSSLTEAKNLLEFTFFCGRVSFESELDAKLWLDERRAHEVNRVVRLLADKAESLSEPRERMYVQFLLSATPRTLFQTYRQFNQC